MQLMPICHNILLESARKLLAGCQHFANWDTKIFLLLQIKKILINKSAKTNK